MMLLVKDITCSECDDVITISIDIAHMKPIAAHPLMWKLKHYESGDHILELKDKGVK